MFSGYLFILLTRKVKVQCQVVFRHTQFVNCFDFFWVCMCVVQFFCLHENNSIELWLLYFIMSQEGWELYFYWNRKYCLWMISWNANNQIFLHTWECFWFLSMLHRPLNIVRMLCKTINLHLKESIDMFSFVNKSIKVQSRISSFMAKEKFWSEKRLSIEKAFEKCFAQLCTL